MSFFGCKPAYIFSSSVRDFSSSVRDVETAKQGVLCMTFAGKMNLVIAYAAVAFVGAIVLGVF